jgi:cell division septation protein DedD
MCKASRGVATALLGVLVALAAWSVRADVTNPTDKPIGVAIDGSRISFTGNQPLEVHGSALLPLRSLFDALGARVDYDSATRTVIADKDDQHIVLPLNSTMATINGQSLALSQPAQLIGGTTYVPLRFVAEAFGDCVEWNAPTHMVMIQTPKPSPVFLAHRRSAAPQTQPESQPEPSNNEMAATQPAPPAPPEAAPTPAPQIAPMPSPQTAPVPLPAGFSIDGYVRRVLTDATPMEIEAVIGGTDQLIRLDDDAIVERGLDRSGLSTVAWTELRPGDHIAVRVNKRDNAILILATYGDRSDQF